MARSQDSFVGRIAELDALANVYAQALGGQARIVCVEGPAGIGKTALIRAFLAVNVTEAVVAASGDEAEMTLPWGVLSQLAVGQRGRRPGPLGHLAELRPGTDPLASGRSLLDGLGEPTSMPSSSFPPDRSWRPGTTS